MFQGDYMNGILPIYKEANMTSHDVVARLRKILHIQKIGHSGTLDPDATGVLLVLVGKATKILPFLDDTDKEYIATLKLGISTDSDDVSGKIMETREIKQIEHFEELLHTFKGKQKQLPPMISSVRVNGKKLYEYARNNIPVTRPYRDIEIYNIEVLDTSAMKFKVACSSGTYIRTLCVDIAKKSGNIGCMESLIRTRVGRFIIDDCVTLNDIENGNIPLFPIKDALSHYPMMDYEPITDIVQGKHIRLHTSHTQVAIINHDEVFAIYEKDHEDVYRCVRGLW